MKDKPFYKKIPLWGWMIIVVFSLGVISLIATPIRVKEKTETEGQTNQLKQKSVSAETEQKIEQLRADIVENLNESVDNIFTKSYIEHIVDNSFKVTLTVNDKWYYLKEFQQERLLEDACKTFEILTVKHGLRQVNDMPWEVTFLDTYEKKVAQDNCW